MPIWRTRWIDHAILWGLDILNLFDPEMWLKFPEFALWWWLESTDLCNGTLPIMVQGSQTRWGEHGVHHQGRRSHSVSSHLSDQYHPRIIHFLSKLPSRSLRWFSCFTIAHQTRPNSRPSVRISSMLIILADNAAWCRSNAFENVPASTSLEIHSYLSLPPSPNSTILESDGVVNAIESPPVVAEPAVTALEEVTPDNTERATRYNTEVEHGTRKIGHTTVRSYYLLGSHWETNISVPSNLCAMNWVSNHSSGTRTEFAEFWGSLDATIKQVRRLLILCCSVIYTVLWAMDLDQRGRDKQL